MLVYLAINIFIVLIVTCFEFLSFANFQVGDMSNFKLDVVIHSDSEEPAAGSPNRKVTVSETNNNQNQGYRGLTDR